MTTRDISISVRLTPKELARYERATKHLKHASLSEFFRVSAELRAGKICKSCGGTGVELRPRGR